MASAILGLLIATAVPAGSPDARQFGFDTVRVFGKSADGQRPLLLIMVEYSDSTFVSPHTPSFYGDLLFGPTGSGSFGSDPGNIGEQRGFIEENSLNDLRFVSAVDPATGALGPFANPDDPDTAGDERTQECAGGGVSRCDGGSADGTACTSDADCPDAACVGPTPTPRNDPDATFECGLWVFSDARGSWRNFSSFKIIGNAIRSADEAGFDFASFDRNFDDFVTRDELTIMVINARPPSKTGGASRGTSPRFVPVSGGVEVRTGLAGIVDQSVGAGTVAHELMHLLGISWEGYGSSCRSQGYTIASCTIARTIDQRMTVHQDPYHKMKLGWVRPEIITTGTDRCVDLAPAEFSSDVLLAYDPNRGTSEYFLLEYRNAELTPLEDGIGPEEEPNYDGDPWNTGRLGLADDSGLAIWYVQIDSNTDPVSLSADERMSLPNITGGTKGDRAVYLVPPRADYGEPLAGAGLWGKLEPKTEIEWPDGAKSGLMIDVFGEGRTDREGEVLRVALGDAVCSDFADGGDDGDLAVDHRCLVDPGLAEIQCAWVHDDFFLERTVSWPVEPGGFPGISWTVTPRRDLIDSQLSVVDTFPSGWISPQQPGAESRELVFNLGSAAKGVGQSQTQGYTLQAPDGFGTYLAQTDVAYQPSAQLSAQPGNFSISSEMTIAGDETNTSPAPAPEFSAPTVLFSNGFEGS